MFELLVRVVVDVVNAKVEHGCFTPSAPNPTCKILLGFVGICGSGTDVEGFLKVLNVFQGFLLMSGMLFNSFQGVLGF